MIELIDSRSFKMLFEASFAVNTRDTTRVHQVTERGRGVDGV